MPAAITSSDKDTALTTAQLAHAGAWRVVDTWDGGERWQLPYSAAEITLTRGDDGQWTAVLTEG